MSNPIRLTFRLAPCFEKRWPYSRDPETSYMDEATDTLSISYLYCVHVGTYY